jgi:hypothetical protein
MASGIDDSAQTLYYSNINYNNTTNPKSSAVTTDLQSRFLYNQSNYQVSINKLKISSLEGVRLGRLPFRTWELGLKITDANNVPQYSSAYVAQANLANITEFFEYVSYYSFDQQVIYTYKCEKNSQTLFTTFQPLNAAGDNVYPEFCFYNPTLDCYYATDYNNIYVYNATGGYITTAAAQNIVSVSIDTSNFNLLVCIAYSGTPTSTYQLNIYNFNGTILSAPRVVNENHAGGQLLNINCAASDGTTLIIAWNNVNITTYNAVSLASVVDKNLGSTLRIKSLVIDTAQNRFIILNDQYIPALIANTINQTFVNLVTIPTGVNIMNTQYNAFYSIAGSPSSTFAAGGSGGTASANFYTGAFSTIVASSQFSGNTLQANTPSYVCYYNTVADGGNFILGNYNDGAVTSLVIYGGNGNWVIVNNISSNVPVDTYQVSCNWFDGRIWLISANSGEIYVSNQAPLIAGGTLDFTGVVFEQVSSFTNIQSICWDPRYPNTCYAVAANNIIYRGYVLTTALGYELNLREYLWNAGVTYCKYLTIQYTNTYLLGDESYNLNGYNLATFALTDTYQTDNNNVLLNMGKSFSTNKLFIPDVSASVINTYDATSLVVDGTLTGITGEMYNIGVTTSSEPIPPTLEQEAIYNMQTFVESFNNCFAKVWSQLAAVISNIQIATPPYFELDYTTHRLTLNYDPKYALAINGIYINDPLYRFTYFLGTQGDGDLEAFNKLVLSPSGSIVQAKETMYLLNEVDKLIIVSNMSLNSDYSGQFQSSTFTDLDFDTQNQFFNMDGNFIYSAVLLRKYDMTSNSELRTISYQIFIEYKDETQVPYMIPPNENISIKYEFDRIY